MENITVAVIQQRMSIPPTHEEFEAVARRFLRQAQAKAAQLTVFPELTGVMLAPPLIRDSSAVSSSATTRASVRPQASFPAAWDAWQARPGAPWGAASGAASSASCARGATSCSMPTLTSLAGWPENTAPPLWLGVYTSTMRKQTLSRTVPTSLTLPVRSLATRTNSTCTADEQGLVAPGSTLNVLQTRYGRLGIVIGLDALYPEVARLLAMQGADLLVGITASPGAPQARAVRSALGVRAEENQVFAVSSFLLGPNYLGRENREDFFGQSALLAPISLTHKGDGILLQAGTDRTETIIAGELPVDELYALRQEGRFRPRQQMWLGELGPVLADFYQQGLTIEQVIERDSAVAAKRQSLKRRLPPKRPGL